VALAVDVVTGAGVVVVVVVVVVFDELEMLPVPSSFRVGLATSSECSPMSECDGAGVATGGGVTVTAGTAGV